VSAKKEVIEEEQYTKIEPEGKEAEDVYTLNDLVANAGIFGVKPEAIIGAMKMAGKEEATKKEISKFLAEFLRKEV